MPIVFASLLSKNWKWLTVLGAALALLVGVQLYKSQRDEARRQYETAQAQRLEALARLQVSNASIRGMQSEIDQQNGAITQLGVDSDKRLMEGRALILAEVRRGSAASVAATKLISAPKTGGDQARSSDAVMAMRNNL